MGSSTPYSSTTTNAEDRMRNMAGNVADKAADFSSRFPNIVVQNT